MKHLHEISLYAVGSGGCPRPLVRGLFCRRERVPEPRSSPESSIAAGRSLIAAYGCGSCHSIPGVPGAYALAAPPLDHFYQRSYIAGRLPNTGDNLSLWIQNPQQIDPGNAMPNLGVTPDEARAIVAYLYHKPDLADWLNH